MSFEEEFDRKIKMKMDEAAFPFDPANWEKASAMIDASRGAAATTAKKWYLPVAIIGLATFGLAVYFWPGTGSEEQKSITQAEQPQTLAAEQNNVADLNTIQNTTGIATESAEPNATLANERINAITESDNSANSSGSNKIKPATNGHSEIAPNSVTTGKSKESETRDQQINKEIKEVNTQLAKDKEQQRQTSGFKPELSISIPLAERAEAASNNNKEQKSPANGNESLKEPINFIPEEGLAMEPQNALLVPSTASYQQTESDFSVYYLAQSQGLLPQIETGLRETKFVLLKRYDDDYYHNRHAPKNYFVNAEAGAFYNFGWQAVTVKDGSGLNAYAGMNFAHYLTKKTAAGVGIQVFNLGHVSQPFYKGTNTAYDFYTVSTGTTIVAQNTTFLSFPFRFYYMPNKATHLGAGISGNYMLQARNSYAVNSTHNDVTAIENTSEIKGVYANANRLTLQASVFYTRELVHGLSIKAEYIYGLTDLYKNTGGMYSTERLHGIKAGLIFTFIK